MVENIHKARAVKRKGEAHYFDVLLSGLAYNVAHELGLLSSLSHLDEETAQDRVQVINAAVEKQEKPPIHTNLPGSPDVSGMFAEAIDS